MERRGTRNLRGSGVWAHLAHCSSFHTFIVCFKAKLTGSRAEVYGQIVDWYPLNSNFQCPPREGSCKGAAAFKGADSTGALFTALCPDFFRGPGGTDCKTFNKGYLSLLLHELSHQTEATIGWGVDDGPRDANGGLCYGAECVQRWARDATNCTNGHMADAYALFAAAVNCSSPAGGVGTLPAAADWTGVPAGYASSLPQGDAPNGTTYATPPAPQAGPSSTTLVPVPTPLPAQPNSAANNGSQSPPVRTRTVVPSGCGARCADPCVGSPEPERGAEFRRTAEPFPRERRVGTAKCES